MAEPTMQHHYLQSSFREKTLEHLFVSECLKALWKRKIYDVEILRSEVDAAGYDIVFELRGIVRHVQLKAPHLSAKAAHQKLNRKLAEKPSGCVVWIVFNADTLALGPYRWFGSSPGKKLPDLMKYPRAKHTKANSQGVKLERVNFCLVPKRDFRELATIDEVLNALFGRII